MSLVKEEVVLGFLHPINCIGSPPEEEEEEEHQQQHQQQQQDKEESHPQCLHLLGVSHQQGWRGCCWQNILLLPVPFLAGAAALQLKDLIGQLHHCLILGTQHVLQHGHLLLQCRQFALVQSGQQFQ